MLKKAAPQFFKNRGAFWLLVVVLVGIFWATASNSGALAAQWEQIHPGELWDAPENNNLAFFRPSGQPNVGTANLSSGAVGYWYGIKVQATVPLNITEIMFDPQSSDSHWEWAEIYNAGTTDIDLTNFIFDDDDGTFFTSANIIGGIVPAKGTAILFDAGSVSIAKFQTAWGADVNAVPVSSWPQLNNTGGDHIGLWQNLTDYETRIFATTIDDVDYEKGSNGWPSPDGYASIYLTDLALDNNNGNNWRLSSIGGETPTHTGYQSLLTNSGTNDNSGEDIGSPGPNEPTAITLDSFTAVQGSAGATVTWETGTEIDNAGFNLHRATAEDGPYTQINDALIPARGDAVSGTSYSYLDTAATNPDMTYYYKLEDIDFNGVSTFHGPVNTASGVSVEPANIQLYLPLILK